MERSAIATIINDNKYKCAHKFNVSKKDGSKDTMRLFVSRYGDICQFARRSSKRGYIIYNLQEITAVEPVKKQPTTPAKMFLKNVNKAAQLLQNSGLWPDMYKDFAQLAKLTENEVSELLSLSDRLQSVIWGTDEYKQAQKDFSDFLELRGIRNDIENWLVCQLTNKGQIVSVPYDKYEREGMRTIIADEIRKAHESNTENECNHRWYGSYDYSVSVARGKDGNVRGWYSAEFKGCGNGHYYLLLDESHALFYEND